MVFYHRILSNYDKVKEGKSLELGNDFGLFWTLSALLVFAYLIVLILKYFCLNMCLLNSTQSIHRMMVRSVTRSPMKFFDLTPSGTLTNKFTNDLTVVENNLIYSLISFF
jgi:ABC-type multidrug transport system fused ATPase/permease subunit